MSSASYRNQCEGKHRHKSSGKADAHIRSLIKQKGVDSETMKSYYCCWCKHWHVGRKWNNSH